MVFQSYAVFPHMTVTRTSRAAGRAPDGRAEHSERIVEALRLVQLAELGSATGRQLSGGQQQRVALARAM